MAEKFSPSPALRERVASAASRVRVSPQKDPHPPLASQAVPPLPRCGRGLSRGSPALAAPGRDQQTDRQEERGEGGKQRDFAEAGHQIIAVFAQPHPIVARGDTAGRHPANFRHRARAAGPSLSAVVRTSAYSTGLSGPAAASAVWLPSLTR